MAADKLPYYTTQYNCVVMVRSVPNGQLVFSSRPVVRTVRYVIPLVRTSEQLGYYFVLRVRQFMRPSPSWRKKRARRMFVNVLTRSLCIYLHCYFAYRKLDASSILIRQHKRVSPRAFRFSGVFSARRMRHNANHVTVSMFRIRNKFLLTHKNTSYISISAEFRDKGNFALQRSFSNCNCTLPPNW